MFPSFLRRTEDLNGDGDAADPGEDGWYPETTKMGFLENDVYNAPPGSNDAPFGYGYYFKLVRSGAAGNAPPNWQARPGAIITDDHFVRRPCPVLITVPPAGVTSAIWRAVPNIRPLKAIRITTRFIDQSTGQMRQNTIIQSLVD